MRITQRLNDLEIIVKHQADQIKELQNKLKDLYNEDNEDIEFDEITPGP